MTHDPETGEVLDAMTLMEAKIGIPSLSDLLPERAKLVHEVAPLRAKHGNFGTAETLRKIELAKLRTIIRALATKDGRKVTNDQIDDEAHASGAYIDFIIAHTNERARWIELENRVQGITDAIMRGQAVARFASAEAHLS